MSHFTNSKCFAVITTLLLLLLLLLLFARSEASFDRANHENILYGHTDYRAKNGVHAFSYNSAESEPI